MRQPRTSKDSPRPRITPGARRAAGIRDAATAQRALRERALRALARPEEEERAARPHPHFHPPSRGPAVWAATTDKPRSSSPAPRATIPGLNLRDGHDSAARTRTTDLRDHFREQMRRSFLCAHARKTDSVSRGARTRSLKCARSLSCSRALVPL